MKHRILVIDTSILCVWLKVPGMEVCGPQEDQWDYKRVKEKIDEEIEQGAYLILPIATLIETGNHITHIKDGNLRRQTAEGFCEFVLKATKGDSPWTSFVEQLELWESQNLCKLIETWWKEIGNQHSMGDASIADVAQFYYGLDWNVEILSGDQLLRTSYAPQSIQAKYVPRRRKNA